MSYRISEGPARDINGKFIIEPDTPNKDSNHFYRQKGGSLYYETAAGDILQNELKFCVEASKQEQCKVNFSSSLGIIPVTPEMSEQDALNSLICHQLCRESPLNEEKAKIEKMKAQQNAPQSLNFSDFYTLEEFWQSGGAKIKNFCKANDINDRALRMHYELAIDYAKSKGGSYEIQVIRATEHFGLPEIITKDNLPELKKKLVLSKDDPRVAETRKAATLSRDYQKE